MALTRLRRWKTVQRLWPTGNGQVPVRESGTIEIDGVSLGDIVSHQLGVLFIAADDRASALDQSVWPTPEYARRAARQLFRSNTSRIRSGRFAWTASGSWLKKIRVVSAAQ
jgi:hypothetical protein